MSVVINMKMPESCKKCDFSIFAGSSYWCSKCGEWCLNADKRLDNCPILTELPVKHGRLIDADALMEDIRKHSESYFADDFAHEWVDKQPTIIEAEGAEE